MMDRKSQKKKDREREVQKKLQRRRQGKLNSARKQRQWEEEKLRESGVVESKILPFHKRTEATYDPEELKARLEKNLQILQALEDEYQKENADKPGLMEALKKSGVGILNPITGVIEEITTEVVEEAMGNKFEEIPSNV
jgi:hypothetical protein